MLQSLEIELIFEIVPSNDKGNLMKTAQEIKIKLERKEKPI